MDLQWYNIPIPTTVCPPSTTVPPSTTTKPVYTSSTVPHVSTTVTSLLSSTTTVPATTVPIADTPTTNPCHIPNPANCRIAPEMPSTVPVGVTPPMPPIGPTTIVIATTTIPPSDTSIVPGNTSVPTVPQNSVTSAIVATTTTSSSNQLPATGTNDVNILLGSGFGLIIIGTILATRLRARCQNQ